MSTGVVKSKPKRAPTVNPLSPPRSELRRSHCARRPSLHKIESDTYEAESQQSSRAPTPSQLKSNAKPKNTNGQPGNRPGRIVQPTDAWTAQHSESPEPLVEPRSPRDSSDMEGESPQVKTISKAKAIKRVSARLGYDSSNMPEDLLQEVLEDIEAAHEETEAGCPSPMEIEDRTSTALWQSPNIMGRGPQRLAEGAPDDLDASEELPMQLAYPDALFPLGRTLSKVSSGDDTATEDSDDDVEIRPEDSVSQRVPGVSESQPPQHNSLQHDLATDNARIAKRPPHVLADEPDIVELPTKRPQTAPTPLPKCAHQSSILAPRDDARSSVSNRVFSIHRTPTHTAALRDRIIFSTVPNRSSAQSSSPPPISDVDAVLTWATRLTAKASRSQPDTTDVGIPYARLTSVLESLRAQLAAAPLKPQARPIRRLGRPKDTDSVEDDAELLEAQAALALGKRINAPHKPCLSDFPGFHRHIASNAIPDLVATLITEGPYELHGTVSGWAGKSYGRRWVEEIPNEPFQAAPRALLGIMVHRGSCFRLNTMDRIQPEIPHLWPFIRTPHTPEDLRYNQRLAKRLLPNQFHCRNTKTGADPYEHAALQACIDAALFWGRESLGVAFEERFRPVPLPAVAFVLTKMQHGIEEMATGRFVKIELNVDEQRKSYESHLLGLLKYRKKAPSRLLAFQEKWFKLGMAHSGADLAQEVAPYQAIMRADQIRDDTPVRDDALVRDNTPVRDVVRRAFVEAKGRAVY